MYLNMPRQVEEYIASVAACVVSEGGKWRQLKNIIGPILEEVIISDDQLSEYI